MKRILLTTIMLCGFGLQAKEAPNGAGGICYQSGCITLSEAGLELDPNYAKRPYDISHELALEVKTIIDMIPLHVSSRRALLDAALHVSGGFLPVIKVDESKYQNIMKEYYKVLEGNSSVDVSTVELLAFSDGSFTDEKDKNKKRKTDGIAQIAERKSGNSKKLKTFLPPKFFESNLRSQALTLIHEAGVRGKKAEALVFQLKIDTMLLAYVNGSADLEIDFYLYLKMLYPSEKIDIVVPLMNRILFHQDGFSAIKDRNLYIKLNRIELLKLNGNLPDYFELTTLAFEKIKENSFDLRKPVNEKLKKWVDLCKKEGQVDKTFLVSDVSFSDSVLPRPYLLFCHRIESGFIGSTLLGITKLRYNSYVR